MRRVERATPPRPQPVREFNFSPVGSGSLSNGLYVLSSRPSDLPLTTLSLIAHAGAEHDQPATAGLANLTARALEAGTSSLSADRIAWEFEQLGAELNVSVAWDAVVLSVTVSTARIEPALALLAEIVTNPALADDEIGRLRGEQLAELAQRRAEPRTLASDMASRFIFVPDVPYSRPLVGTPASVRHLTAGHVRDFYALHWHAGAAGLIAVGNLDHDAIMNLAARHLNGWTGRPRVPVEFDAATTVERTQVFIVDREGSVQSEMRVGHVGVARGTADYFPLQVGNGVLGGVFTSRLNMSLREKHGFTYGVRSAYGFRKHPGPFMIQTAVATDVTGRALEETLKETHVLLEDGATEEEIVATREYMAGVMPLEMQTTEQFADRLADVFVYGLAPDYLPQHRAALMSVSREEANDALRAHVHPDRFAITIVGDAKAIESELASLQVGPIEVHTADE